jgi:D-glycero-D-manno-heptose 1,7-bisphosphate phosphatase
MKAVLLDREGVVNRLIYDPEQGVIDSPFTAAQFQFLPGVSQAINKFHKMGYKVVLISSQPGIAKGHMSEQTFEKIRSKMREGLAKDGAFLDGEYYCFHHPEAKVEKLKANCECRKPKPGLLVQAAKEMDIDLPHSWMIGDGLTMLKRGRMWGKNHTSGQDEM